MAVLVTGGAGYIGSSVVLALTARGDRVVVLDDLSVGRREQVAPEADFVQGDAGDRALVGQLIESRGVDAVIHLAGVTSIPESTREPARYYERNTGVSAALIETCAAAGVGVFVFSSTAAVYAMSGQGLVDETALTQPPSPYGRSKLMTEQRLALAERAGGPRFAALRYFNVAGADPELRAGPPSACAGGLVRRACQAALGGLEALPVFGSDYPTPDGTCVRDYVHVTDLAEAHVLALDHLRAGGASLTLNCGYGEGASVREVIAAVEAAAGSRLATHDAPRRPGDLPAVVADASRLKAELGWTPRRGALPAIVADALAWERKLAADA